MASPSAVEVEAAFRDLANAARCLGMAHDLREKLISENRLDDAQMVGWLIATIKALVKPPIYID